MTFWTDDEKVWLYFNGPYRGDMLCEHIRPPNDVRFYRGYAGLDSGAHPRWIYMCNSCWFRYDPDFKEWLLSNEEPDNLKEMRLNIWKRIFSRGNSRP